MNQNLVITLDGPAGSGKSSVAKQLAKRLGLLHADSGAMYRTFTLALMQRLGPGLNPDEFGNLVSSGPVDPASLKVEVKIESDRQSNLISGADQGDAIRSPDVTSRIKHIADRREYREAVNRLLSNMKGIVADGRDMGSVVFPAANFKFYLEASVEMRADRRLKELQAKGWNEDIEALRESIRKRDAEDQNREWGALKRTDDMILIDTTHLNLDGVLRRILNSLQIQF
ncbi:MAG: (d)CMP kinase [Leptospirales bacterium]|nr:(d)CMP kinase [Leptospirales bacterium]